ncbi:eukaryotic translation initiation factor 4E1-like [Bradysia coprophila]|uniref:eukaryotic translation initiation factor 4E1-like n=1 Tax=Bradysia coprophila TaxID=38358 RepID=UPI00187D9574|nr:eukaryotic translation initiation factor 4E1-like [Bradysia coprophila]
MPAHNKQQKMQSDIVKHPLHDRWTMWYLKQDQKKKWEEMLSKVETFDMVEDFWSIYNHIRQPSELSQGDDYSMFKNDIRPMWEDAANKNGGRWLLNVDKQYRRTKLDDFWLDTLLCIMGEPFEFHEDINGAVVNVRFGGDRISIWTSDAKKKKSVMAIGRKLKEYLRLDSHFKLYYEVHSASKNTTPLYTI